MTQVFTPTDADIQTAAQVLRSGGLIAFPTETVYGLGANAMDETAVQAIYTAKGRPSNNPLIVHVADAAQIAEFAMMDDVAQKLANAFWPGPMTLVLPLIVDGPLAPTVTAGLNTVAVRIPNHPIAAQLLKHANTPIAAPSANPSGQISPTQADHVLSGLHGRIDGVIQGDGCNVGLESTIVGFSPAPTLLRAGGIAVEALEQVLGTPIAHHQDSKTLTAPGQMLSHYAPDAPVRLNVVTPQAGEVYLGFGPMQCDENLSPSGDLNEAAENLFAALHRLNATGRPIAVAPIPSTGVGLAINDRLTRAAAPRD